MNILLCYKWKRDPGDAAIASDGALKWYFTTLKPSDDESSAIVSARQIAESTNGDITAVTIGDGDPSWALARGAKKVISVPEFLPHKDEVVTGARLAEVIKYAGEYDVILMGDNQEFSGVAPATAAFLGLPIVSGVASVRFNETYPNCLVATRVTDDAQETLKITLPAVISITATDSEKLRPTMRQMMMAKKMPIEAIAAADVDTIPESKLEEIGTAMPESREALIIEGEPKEAAEKLAAILRDISIL